MVDDSRRQIYHRDATYPGAVTEVRENALVQPPKGLD